MAVFQEVLNSYKKYSNYLAGANHKWHKNTRKHFLKITCETCVPCGSFYGCFSRGAK
jgi:hypothetical protein